MKDGERWLIADTELRQLGLQDAVGDAVKVEGRSYRVLRSLGKVQIAIDEGAGRIDLVADPAVFGQQRLDLTPAPHVMPTYDSSAFFNYQLNWEGADHQRSSYGVNTELAVRHGRWLFDNQTNYLNDANGSAFTRLGTNATYDWYEKLARFVAGDQAASTGGLGQSMQLGGIGFYRAYGMDPELITTPTARFAGATPVAGEVEVYVDGIRVYSAPVKPGTFELDNITRYAGLRQVDVVIRDALGQVIQRSSSKTYLSRSACCAPVLTNSPMRSDWCGPRPASAATAITAWAWRRAHRVGLTDALTVGAHVDRTPDYATAGADATVRLGDFGIIGVEGAAGRPQLTGQVAGAANLLYSYSADGWGFDLNYRRLQRGFLPASTLLPQFVPLKDAGVQLSYGSPRYGTFTATATRSDFDDGSRQSNYTLRYNIHPPRTGTSTRPSDTSPARAAHSRASARRSASTTFSAMVPRRRPGSSARRGAAPNTTSKSPARCRSAPASAIASTCSAAPASTWCSLRSSSTPTIRSTRSAWRDPSVPTPMPRRRRRRSPARSPTSAVSATFTRPIYDSFAVVKAGSLEGVRVLQNSQDAGRTGRDGTMFGSTVGSYVENRFTLDPNSVPIDTIIGQNSVVVVPALRGGVLVDFALHPQRALSGILMLRRGPQERPLGGIDALLVSGTAQMQLFTAADGGFYIEDAAPGSYSADIRVEGGRVPRRGHRGGRRAHAAQRRKGLL